MCIADQAVGTTAPDRGTMGDHLECCDHSRSRYEKPRPHEHNSAPRRISPRRCRQTPNPHQPASRKNAQQQPCEDDLGEDADSVQVSDLKIGDDLLDPADLSYANAIVAGAEWCPPKEDTGPAAVSPAMDAPVQMNSQPMLSIGNPVAMSSP